MTLVSGQSIALTSSIGEWTVYSPHLTYWCNKLQTKSEADSHRPYGDCGTRMMFRVPLQCFAL